MVKTVASLWIHTHLFFRFMDYILHYETLKSFCLSWFSAENRKHSISNRKGFNEKNSLPQNQWKASRKGSHERGFPSDYWFSGHTTPWNPESRKLLLLLTLPQVPQNHKTSHWTYKDDHLWYFLPTSYQELTKMDFTSLLLFKSWGDASNWMILSIQNPSCKWLCEIQLVA